MDPVSGVSSIVSTPVNFTPRVNNGLDPLLQVQLARVTGVSTLLGVNPTDSLFGLGGVTPSSTVQLSGLGLLLSSLDTFQAQIESVQQATALEQEATLESVTTAAEDFAAAFNALGTINNALTDLGAPLSGNVAANQLTNQLNNFGKQLFVNTPTATNSTNASTATVTTLAQIGINLQPATTLGQVGTFTVNAATLQTAFTTNPAATAALLNRAARQLNQLATGFNAPGGILPSVMQQLQWGLGLIFGPGWLNGVSNLEHGAFIGPQALAVQQYARIAALAAVSTFVGGSANNGFFA
jgi:hypothetical protein